MEKKETAIRRNTVQRRLVLDAVCSLHNHASADEIYDFIVRKHPGIGRGTVYRNLNILAGYGFVRRISVPGGSDRFDHCTKDHSHAVCSVCKRVFDIDTAPIGDLSVLVSDSHGFLVDGFDLFYRGVCAECIKKMPDKIGMENLKQ